MTGPLRAGLFLSVGCRKWVSSSARLGHGAGLSRGPVVSTSPTLVGPQKRFKVDLVPFIIGPIYHRDRSLEIAAVDEAQPDAADHLDAVLREQIVVQPLDAADAVFLRVGRHHFPVGI